jgi:hypothetical protein
MRGRFRLFDLIRSRADRTSLARYQSTTAHSWRRPNRFPKLSGQHPRPDHAQRARLSGRWRRPQVKDIFPQAVEVELPGDDTPACGGAPKGDELLSPNSARCHGSARTSCAAAAAASQKVPPTMTAAHPAGRKSRRQNLARHRRQTCQNHRHGRRLSGALIGFDRTQQSLAPEQCLRRATLRLAHGLEQGACHLSAAVWAGSTTGSWPNFSPPSEFREGLPCYPEAIP